MRHVITAAQELPPGSFELLDYEEQQGGCHHRRRAGTPSSWPAPPPSRTRKTLRPPYTPPPRPAPMLPRRPQNAKTQPAHGCAPPNRSARNPATKRTPMPAPPPAQLGSTPQGHLTACAGGQTANRSVSAPSSTPNPATHKPPAGRRPPGRPGRDRRAGSYGRCLAVALVNNGTQAAVPPQRPQDRRRQRTRQKTGQADALLIARTALREDRLPPPRPQGQAGAAARSGGLPAGTGRGRVHTTRSPRPSAEGVHRQGRPARPDSQSRRSPQNSRNHPRMLGLPPPFLPRPARH